MAVTKWIAPEGWSRIGVAIALALGAHLVFGFWLALPLWIIAALVVQFFRDPPRQIPRGDRLVVSPAHGKIVSIAPDRDPFSGEAATRISIFMNIFSVHSNRIPIAGEIIERQHIRGRFFNAALDKASLENERCGIRIRTDDNKSVTCVQIAGWVARRILTYVDPGDRVKTGERYGFIRFGSRVDVFLPPDATVVGKLGKWVLSGSDIIAELSARVDHHG